MARPGQPIGPPDSLEPICDPAFFARHARVVARDLLGCVLVVDRGARSSAVRIVETEAYAGPRDAACHARFGITERNRAIFGPPGTTYVFLVYGMHHCFNVVCFREGSGHAVLVRAGEPVWGIAEGVRGSGPGLLTRALGIDRRTHDGLVIGGGRIAILRGPGPARIVSTPRVGVGYAGPDADRAWRFFDADSQAVSRPPASQLGQRAPRPRRGR